MPEIFFLDINFQNEGCKSCAKDKYNLQHVYAYSLLMYIIEVRYGLHLKKSDILKTPLGKPYINCKNLCVNFSISHSENLVVVAVSNNKIGIDVEVVKHMKFNVGGYSDYFTNEELKFIANNKNEAAAFSILWTRKEACLKYYGAGLESLTQISMPAKGASINSFFVQAKGSNKYAISVACEKSKEIKNFGCNFRHIEKYVNKFAT